MFKKLLFLTAAVAFAGLTLVSCSSDDKSTDPKPDKVFKVLSPNGGEIYQKGETVKLTFKNELEGDVAISLYKAGEFVYTINAAETSKDSSLWVVPTTLTTGTDYKIRIENLSDSTKFDLSDANFTVAPAGEYIIVNSSNGGDIWLKGQTKHITWLDNISGTVDIFLYKNGISISELTSISPEPSDGDYAWVIPDDGTFLDGADYQFLIVSTDTPAVYDFSDHVFCLATNDNTQNIVGSWDAAGTWAKWDTVLEFYQDGTWLNTQWTVDYGTWSMTGNGLKMNFAGNTRCFLAIVDDDDINGSMAEGDNYGTWSAVRLSPDVISPNGGEVWLRGTTQTITWTPVSKGDVTLSLADSTGVVQNIATVADSLGTYDWAVPNTITPNADYKIKIAQVINPVSSDESDNYFCISANETVDVIGEWKSSWTLTKGNMTMVFNSDGTGTWGAGFNGNWTLTGNGLKFVIDYAYTNYWIAIVDGDKFKGTFRDGDVNKGIWDGKREIEVTAPNGGNVFQPADVVPITWTENLSAEYVKIDLYENDVLARTLFSNTINDNDQNWTVPADLTTSTKYKIRITSAVDNDIYDESDNYFTVNGVDPVAQEDETFDDGLAQNWTTVNGTWTVSGGQLNSADSLANYSYSFVYNTILTGNYVIEAKMKKISGSDNEAIGFQLNGDHNTVTAQGFWSNMALVTLTSDGQYGFFSITNGAWTQQTGWIPSSYVNSGLDVWNTLKVIVDNSLGNYHVFVNDNYIQTINFTTFSSGEVGLFVYDGNGVSSGAFDDVSIRPVNKADINAVGNKVAKLHKKDSVSFK